MAIKTFTTGEVLTAADTNTYLANSGLVFVKSQTIGSAVTSVSVTDAFSATYDNYKVIVSGGVASGIGSIQMVLGASVTGYYSSVVYVAYASPGTVLGATDNNAAIWSYMGYGTSNYLAMNVDILNPFAAKHTTYGNAQWSAQTVAGQSNGVHAVATSYTGFTLSVAGGFSMTGGTITVYGYRKP